MIFEINIIFAAINDIFFLFLAFLYDLYDIPIVILPVDIVLRAGLWTHAAYV